MNLIKLIDLKTLKDRPVFPIYTFKRIEKSSSFNAFNNEYDKDEAINF